MSLSNILFFIQYIISSYNITRYLTPPTLSYICVVLQKIIFVLCLQIAMQSCLFQDSGDLYGKFLSVVTDSLSSLFKKALNLQQVISYQQPIVIVNVTCYEICLPDNPVQPWLAFYQNSRDLYRLFMQIVIIVFLNWNRYKVIVSL